MRSHKHWWGEFGPCGFECLRQNQAVSGDFQKWIMGKLSDISPTNQMWKKLQRLIAGTAFTLGLGLWAT